MTLDVPESQAIDAGIYPATLTKLELKEIEKGEYAGDTIRIWTFNVEVDGKLEPVSGSSSLAFGPKSKAYEWFTAIMGRSPVFGEKGVDIVGRRCSLWLIVDPDSGYNRIKQVLPATDKGQQPVAAVSAAPGAFADGLPDLPFADGTPVEEPPVHSQEDMP